MKTGLRQWKITRSMEALESGWFAGPAFSIISDSLRNTSLVVDIVASRWPDEMGKGKKDKSLFGAWATGQFGRLTFPRSLRRAVRQCWGWESGAAMAVKRHKAFARLRTTNTDSCGQSTIGSGNHAMRGLEFVCEVASALMRLDGCLCYFNPAGEVLANRESVEESLQHARSNGQPALEIFANVRFFRLPGDWSLMDVIGNRQFGIDDLEALLPPSEVYDPLEVMVFLRDITLLMLRGELRVEDGLTQPGPKGIKWRATRCNEGLAEPRRKVFRWIPSDGSTLPAILVGRGVKVSK
jgi:hypothetical protein